MKKNKDILIEEIRNGIKKPFSDELVKQIKPAIRIIPSENEVSPKSLSKFGGIPSIKKGEKWMRNQTDHKPYAFLLQLDLEELQSFDINNLLPPEGVLSIWFNLNSWDDGKVIYYKDKTELVQAKVPVELKEEKEREKLPIWKRMFTRRTGFKLFSERFMNFEVEYHSPSWDSLQMKLFHITNNTKSSDLEIDEKYIDNYVDVTRSDHHLLGYYVGLQESIYELMKNTNGQFPNKPTEQMVKEGLEWKLFLQIDSDKLTDMHWVDAGKILFFIKEDDLKNKNFENVFIQLDTT